MAIKQSIDAEKGVTYSRENWMKIAYFKLETLNEMSCELGGIEFETL